MKKNSLLFFIIILFIPLWIFVISPQLLKIPKDFTYTADIISVDNFYDEAEGQYKGEQYSKTKFSYEVVSHEGNTLFIKNTFDVKSLDGKQIFKTEPVYAINSVEGNHVKNMGERERSGYLFSPRGLKKGESFEYWHVSNNIPSTMKYVGEEYIYGLRVYKYEKSNTEAVDQTEFMGFLPGVPEKRGIKLSSKLEMWVEPISGYPVKIEDSSLDYYYYDIRTGERLFSYNKFSNTYSEHSIKEHVAYASLSKIRILLTTFGPFIFLILLIIPLLISKLLIFSRIRDFLKNNKLAIIIFIISVAITLVSFIFLRNSIKSNDINIYNSQSIEIRRLIQEKFSLYENSLYGAKGFFDASDEVTRKDWKSYIDSLDLNSRYPGVLGVGYSKVIRPEEKSALIESIRREGYSDFDITPGGQRNIYTSIIYLEPFDTLNRKAFGFDMFSEEVRRRAMIRARDDASAAASGKLSLLQDADNLGQSGLILYLPVYKNGITPKTKSDREKNIMGYVYVPIRATDFMNDIFKSKKYTVDFHVYEGLGIDQTRMMFDLEHENSYDSLNQKNRIFRKTETIYFAGQPYTFEYLNSSENINNKYYILFSYIFLMMGLGLSLFIFLVIYSNTEGRKKVIKDIEEVNFKLNSNLKEQENSKKAILNVLEDSESNRLKIIRESDKLSTILHSIGDAVFVVDIDLKIILVNEVAASLSGYTINEMIGVKYSDKLKFIFEDTEKINNKFINDAIRTRKVQEMSNHTVLVSKDGKKIHVADSAAPLLDGGGNVFGCVVVFRDVTHEREIDKAKTEFVSLASHQLRTPLTPIRLFSEMLLNEEVGKLNSQQREYVSNIEQSSRRMISLVNDLLNVSRIELGHLKVTPVPTDIVKFVNEIINEIKPVGDIKGCQISLNISEDKIPSINIDTNLIRQVVHNLLTNAVRYAVAKDSKIAVSIFSKGSNYIISVHDNGIGIPKEAQGRIFEKFYRADNAVITEAEGSGLGMYVAKMVMEASGGQIWFESPPKGETIGTVFYVSIPKRGMIEKKGDKGIIASELSI